MPTLVEPAYGPVIGEARPRLPGRFSAIRSCAGERPEDDEELVARAQQSSSSERSRRPRVLSGMRVLVVDDDEDTAELFAAALTACGAEVVAVTSAPEGVRHLAAHATDVVVTDIAMPGADGYWLLREIRQLEDARASAVPVLAVTAFGREHFRTRALSAG